uniref:Reverse transcriptase zinc-binding domain-containing protein n=1 Tax=Cannabis sativa TaxID=3483 RepID=A0A803QC15_CANSA
MATFLIPKTPCLETDQAVRKFWWMGSETKDRFLALCDWTSLCLPLDRGGLNFKKFGDINLALVAKLGWKLANEEDSLWCKIFKAKYWGNRDQTFWTSKVPKNASFGAKGIMATRDLIRNETCWLIADGSKVDLWHSPWIPWLDWNMSRVAFNPLCVQNSIKVSTLLGEDGEWIPRSVHRWFVPSVASSLNLVRRLPRSQEDLLVWKDATNGLFSPRVAYKSIIKGRWGESDQIWNRIWKLQITERLKMFLWKLCRDIIPFGNRLQRIFGNDTRCVICGDADDSAQHLFFKCPLAKAVWFASRWALRSDSLCFDSPRNMVEWLLSPDFLQGADEDDLGILAKVINVAANLQAAWESPRIADVLQQNQTEIYTGNLVLLVDAAFKDMHVAAGIVASVSEGMVLEALAVVIASDCQLLVHGLHAQRAPDWRLADSFWALVELLDDLPEVQIVWTPRAGVQVAHNLAQWAFGNSFSGFLNAKDLVPIVAM